MKKNKSPGPDGFIIEWYDEYWDFIKDDFLEVIKDSLAKGKLPNSHYQAIITLLYKTYAASSFFTSL